MACGSAYQAIPRAAAKASVRLLMVGERVAVCLAEEAGSQPLAGRTQEDLAVVGLGLRLAQTVLGGALNHCREIRNALELLGGGHAAEGLRKHAPSLGGGVGGTHGSSMAWGR